MQNYENRFPELSFQKKKNFETFPKREDGNIIIPENGIMVHTVSCDEKPGIQAIATTGDDLRPTAQNGCVM
ncbi:MAG: hypothetical protein II637_02910, partial [Bacteroidales bacterium]|nr:hypothetical protein [Bacteroidales bacterium]